MKISEVIEVLEKVKSQYGDISCAYEKYKKAWTFLVIKLGMHNRRPVVLLSDNEGLYAKSEPDVRLVEFGEN